MLKHLKESLVATAFALTIVLPCAAGAAVDQAGVSAVVNGNVKRASETFEARSDKDLTVGEQIFLRDVIKSAQQSNAQILLLDETTVTTGPNSELVIDEFVYDPEADSGTLSANFVRGTMRFVSGRIADLGSKKVQIRTPAATIGIRGTIFVTDIVRGADGDVIEVRVVLTGPGPRNNADRRTARIDVAAQGRIVTLRRPGWMVIIRPGEPPSDPMPAPSSLMREMHARLYGPGLRSSGGDVRDAAAAAAGETAAARAADASAAGTQVTSPLADDRRNEDEDGQAEISTVSGQSRATLRSAGDSYETVWNQTTLANVITSPSELPPSNIDSIVTQVGGANPFMAFDAFSTWEEINALPGGFGQNVAYNAANAPIVDLLAFQNFNPQSFADFQQLLNGAQVGSYDFALNIDLGAKRFTSSFTQINLAAIGIANDSIRLAATNLPPNGPAIFAYFAGDQNVAASNGCVSAACIGQFFLLKEGADPLAQAFHALVLNDPQNVDQIFVGFGFEPRR